MQLSSIENITEDNIVFHKAKEQKLRNSKIKYERIKKNNNRKEITKWKVFSTHC